MSLSFPVPYAPQAPGIPGADIPVRAAQRPPRIRNESARQSGPEPFSLRQEAASAGTPLYQCARACIATSASPGGPPPAGIAPAGPPPTGGDFSDTSQNKKLEREHPKPTKQALSEPTVRQLTVPPDAQAPHVLACRRLRKGQTVPPSDTPRPHHMQSTRRSRSAFLGPPCPKIFPV